MKKNNLTGTNAVGTSAIAIVRLLLLGFLAVALTGLAAAQNDSELRFKGAIGVIPVTGVAANGTVNLNVVRGVNPGAPWRIASLESEVNANGELKLVGRGLLLAAGNGIGTNAGQSVHATLFCGPAATATAHNTTLAGVALDKDGDFRINDVLSPLPPTSCESPVLLIRNVGGVWFAAAILKQDVQRHRQE